MITALINEAAAAGARRAVAAELLGVSARMVERWGRDEVGDDRRAGPKTTPANKLSEAERQKVLKVANSAEHRELSPKQIVPKLADKGTYVASESTFYRILREEQQLHHRQKSRPPSAKPTEYVATGPCQVWSWDITYLPSPVRGRFYYLYLVEDVWSRKVVGWSVEETESMDLAASLIQRICRDLCLDPRGLVLHSDNGGPMKGATMLATLQRLGVIASFSRPNVSDDNPYSESLFRTLKYRPGYPSRPFASLEEARAWVAGFVTWYNTEHLHSSIGFVTPEDRHMGSDLLVLEHRRLVYERARRSHPERWSRSTRSWEHVDTVTLNPERLTAASKEADEKAA